MRKRMMRRIRKNLMKLGKITSVIAYAKDEKGNKLPKNERGYSVNALVNGWSISAPDDSLYESYKGCLYCAKLAVQGELGKGVQHETHEEISSKT